jgi:hypothetical protein
MLNGRGRLMRGWIRGAPLQCFQWVSMAAVLCACGGSDRTVEEVGATGGVTSTGGASASGGDPGNGGSTSTGGAGTGGAASTGGAAAQVTCMATSDCQPGQWCSDVDFTTASYYCASNPSGSGIIGAACTSNADCLSGWCRAGGYPAGNCSTLCRDNADCGSAATCVHATNSTSGASYARCLTACDSDTDCQPGAACMLVNDADATHWTTSCGDPVAGNLPFLSVVGVGDTCISYLTFTVFATSTTYCSKACQTSAECGGALPLCLSMAVSNPNGVGTTSVNACSAN